MSGEGPKMFRVILFILLKNFVGFQNSSFYIKALQRREVWNDALNVMSFHRNKMNEYLCRNYIASEIIDNYRNQSNEKIQETKKPKNSRLARESLLEDPGSQKYKDWLSRSSTLEDIYKQFEHTDHDQVAHEAGTGHEGEVTGYALVDNKHHYFKPSGYEDYYSHSYIKDEDEHEEHDEKGLKLKELFHFALTAIAFLAFACFMIEVIMCLLESPQPEPDYVLVPTSTGGTATGPTGKSEIPVTRQQRSFGTDRISIEVLNNMSSKVLSSIEALTMLHEDNGQCFKRALCQNSEYSKSLQGTQKLWLPLWSFGISWIGNRLQKKRNSSAKTYTLDYLKAAVLGLGNNSCHLLYPKCDARKRRRKRKVEK